MKKRVLITGSSGMLGSALCDRCLDEYEVYGADIIESAAIKKGKFFKLDITDQLKTTALIKELKPDLVVHSAAYADVDACEGDEQKACEINTVGTQSIASGCRYTGAFLFYISTDFVFDGKKDSAYTEQDRPNPVNAYGRSKLGGEKAVEDLLDKYMIIRSSWLFGKNGKNFVDAILRHAGEKKGLKVVSDQTGSPTYTEDLAEAIVKLIRSSLTNPSSGICHITNSGAVSRYEYAREILNCAGIKNVTLTSIKSGALNCPARRPKMSALDNGRYHKLTGDKLRDYKEALKEYLSKRRSK